MSDTHDLRQKIRQLEARIKQLEAQNEILNEDKDYMAALSQAARQLIEKHHKSSIIFLQKKLLIDYHRADRLRSQLVLEGVIKV